MDIVKTIPLLSIGFFRAYLTTMRPYLLFVSGITGIFGMSFIHEVSLTKFILLFLASFLSYGFGQALTDCFQIDTDTLSSPYRPLTQGLISKIHVFTISILGLLFCVSVFTFFNPYNLLLGILAGIGLGTYTYFKKRWWGGPFYNAWIVTVLFLLAYYSGIKNNEENNTALVLLSLTSVFFGYANFVLSGYFKDILADSRTGYNTFPVVFGRKKAAVVSDIFASIFVVSALSRIVISFEHIQLITSVTVIVIFLIGIIQLAVSQIKLHKVKNDKDAFQPISLVVHSYILILISMTIMQKPNWRIFLILFYIAFVFTIYIRPAKNQI